MVRTFDHLESFRADPYEMFEQVTRPLSGCRFTFRADRWKREFKWLQRIEHIVLPLLRTSCKDLLFMTILLALSNKRRGYSTIVRS